VVRAHSLPDWPNLRRLEQDAFLPFTRMAVQRVAVDQYHGLPDAMILV
jgi:hypothetical protein